MSLIVALPGGQRCNAIVGTAIRTDVSRELPFHVIGLIAGQDHRPCCLGWVQEQ